MKGAGNMKKILVALFVFVLTVLTLSACGNKVQSVDLSYITFDGASIGDAFEQIETEKYTVSTRYPERYNTYNYEEWRICVENGVITEIIASFGHVSISINGKEGCGSVDDIINILGENYNSSWYDKEQSLMQIQYFDKENGIQCVFVYDKNSNKLVWGIMQVA